MLLPRQAPDDGRERTDAHRFGPVVREDVGRQRQPADNDSRGVPRRRRLPQHLPEHQRGF